MTRMMARIAIGTALFGIGGCLGGGDVSNNHTPTMETMRLYGNEDGNFEFELVAVDVDRDDLELLQFGASWGDLEIQYVSSHLQPDATRLKVAGVYEPELDFNGDASFWLKVSDGKVTFDAADAIVVAPVNDKPTAEKDAIAASANTPAVIFPSTLLANDFDRDERDEDYVRSLAITGVGEASGGTAMLAADMITFTPDNNFSGIARFEYTLSDGGLTDTTVVNLAVGLPNAAPIAEDDYLQIGATSSELVFDPPTLTGNDFDEDGQSLAVIAVANATHGTVELHAGVVTFTPGPDFDGTASFDYTVSDGVDTAAAHAVMGPP